jgi:hypothetical protein
MTGGLDHSEREKISYYYYYYYQCIIEYLCTVKGMAVEEAEANMEMSSLVIYIQPARFHSFDYAESKYSSLLKYSIGLPL